MFVSFVFQPGMSTFRLISNICGASVSGGQATSSRPKRKKAKGLEHLLVPWSTLCVRKSVALILVLFAASKLRCDMRQDLRVRQAH